jgi:hypothetical protein
MPFWALSVPESLQIVGRLKEIRNRHPDQVSIVGLNLDPEEAPLREFLAQNDLGFPSYHSVSSSSASVANPVAARFGLVSMPFVAVIDQQGRVAALEFTGRRLDALVDELVNTPSGSKASDGPAEVVTEKDSPQQQATAPAAGGSGEGS